MTPIERRRLQNEAPTMNKSFKTKARVSKDLVETFVQKNNAVAIKLLFYIGRSNYTPELYNISFRDKSSVDLKLSTKELCEVCNIDKRTLKSNIKTIAQTAIEVYSEDEKAFAYINLLPHAIFEAGNDYIEISIYRYILMLIKDVADKYVTIDIENMMKLQHKHSLKMIQLLEVMDGYSNDVKKQKVYLLEELNGLFGTNYSRATDIERKILSISQNELDQNSKLSFIFEKVFEDQKRGRPKTKGFRIILKENHNRQQRMF